jgi:hypothetical protein
MPHFKLLAALVATLLALGAHAQAPSASPLSATCKPWVVEADASMRDTANLPAEFGTASVAEFQAEWRKRRFQLGHIQAGPDRITRPRMRLLKIQMRGSR